MKLDLLLMKDNKKNIMQVDKKPKCCVVVAV